jgi:hypothetical protein
VDVQRQQQLPQWLQRECQLPLVRRINFLLGPSGRFSNGRNAIDALSELLRLSGFIPPFANPLLRWAPALDDGEANQFLAKIFFVDFDQELLEMAFF